MVRYELSDGKSHKFWAAEVDGGELTTQWGRIGTDGQSKTKSLGSPEAADKELAKLIRAKTKKGYVLVGESAAPAKPAAVKPAAAKPAAAKPAEKKTSAPASLSEAHGSLPDESLPNVEAKYAAVTRGSVKARPLPSTEAAWKRFRSKFGEKLPAETRASLDKYNDGLGAVLDRALKDQTIKFEDVEEAGYFVACLGLAGTYGIDKLTVLDILLATGGVSYALKATLVSAGWSNVRADKPLSEGNPGLVGRLADHTLALRNLLCGLGDSHYAEQLETVSSFEPKFFTQRVMLAFMFPEEARFRDAALDEIRQAQGHQNGGVLYGASSWLLADLVRAEDVELVWKVIRVSITELLGALARLGAKMTPMVMQFATNFEARTWTDKDAEQELAKLLVATPSDEPIAWLVAHMDRPSFSEALSRAAKVYPVRVLTQLGPVATGRGSVAGLAQSLVAQILGQFPGALGVAKAAWDDDMRAKVQKLIADNATAPPADLASVPEIFAKPRWAKKRAKSAKHKPIELSPLEHKSVFKWPAGARERWLNKRGSDEGWGSLSDIAVVFDEVAAQLVQDWKPEGYFDTDGSEQRIIARFGEDAHHIVRSIITLAVGVKCALPFGDVAFAEPIADAYARLKSARKEARAWLLHHPEVAFVGLIPAVVGSKKKPADNARRAIALLVGEGHGDLLLEVAARYGDEARARAEELATLDALDDLPKKIPALPTWCAGVIAPELKTGGSLPREALDVLLTMLAISKPGDPYAGVEVAVDMLTDKSLGRFSWSLFEAWRLGGMDSKQGWAFHQLGLLGDDDCARKLTPILRKWPGEGGHARATQGLDILTEIGSDVALMNLYAISQKLKFKGLKKKAAEKVQEVADARGMSKLELADRLVPDFDLDANGSMTLDFGPRRFEVVFDEHLKPVIRDEEGKVRKSLPKVGAKDDVEKATEATARFKVLKKDVKAVAQMQITRLENVMCEGRTWTQDDFQRFLVDHPLLIHVVRRLIWGVINGDEVKATFRVAEDNTFADADDETITLPEGRVGLVHMLQLSEGAAGKWGDFLADYELLQPFDQVVRTTYALTPAEIKSNSIDRVDRRVVSTSDVLKLGKLGWERGEAQDGGCIGWMQRETSAGLFMLSLDPGIIVGMPMEFAEQTLGQITLGATAWGQNDLPLTNASATQLSEVIRSLDPVRE